MAARDTGYQPVQSDDNSSTPLLDKKTTDIVQFATQIYYGDEEEGKVRIIIMRLGGGNEEVKVQYRTQDASARAGFQYTKVTGEVVFPPNTFQEIVEVPILQDSVWHATQEFRVVLHSPENCELGRYLHTSRVKILDNNYFPTDKYKEKLMQGEEGIEKINGPGLFWAFWKLNFWQEGMAWRTIVTMIFDQFSNANLLLKTWLGKYMVDVVFNIREKSTLQQLQFTNTRIHEAFVVAALFVGPLLILNIWAYTKVKLDLQGRSTSFLRQNFLRRYLNYSEESRVHVDASKIQLAIMQDVDDLAGGYQAFLDLTRIMGTFVVLTYFTLVSNPRAWWVVVIMPLLMLTFVIMRFAGILPEPLDSVPAKKAVLNLINETIRNYQLIGYYFQRPKINEMMTARVNKLRRHSIPERIAGTTDRYVPKWLGQVFLAIYIIVMSPFVLEEGPVAGESVVSLGTFLATIGVIAEASDAFSQVYEVLLQYVATFGPVREVSTFFNLKTDLQQWKAVNRHRQSLTQEARDTMRSSTSAGARSGVFLADKLKLELQDVSFSYIPSKKICDQVTISVDQGKLVAIQGDNASGKRTLLQILGHSLFPSSGHVFVPGHLRIIQVSTQVMLFEKWSAWENLSFGITPIDADPERIRKILHGLKMDQTLALIEDDLQKLSEQTAIETSEVRPEDEVFGDDDVVEIEGPSWIDQLSAGEKADIHLARALIANPEVLILHCVLVHYSQNEKDNVMRTITQHNLNRGVGLPEETVQMRRPRTCFYSVETEEDAKWADVTWRIHEGKVSKIRGD